MLPSPDAGSNHRVISLCTIGKGSLNGFEKKKIIAAVIGEVKKGKIIEVISGKEREVFFDFNKEAIVG